MNDYSLISRSRGDAVEASSNEQLNPFGLVNVVLRRARMIVGWSLGVGVVVAGISMILPKEYNSQVIFRPESEAGGASSSQLLGLAAQFSLDLGVGGTESPQFYEELVNGSRIRNELLLRRFPTPPGFDAGGADSVELVRIFA